MKRLLIFAAIFVLLVSLIVGVYLVISLLSMEADTTQTESILTTQPKSDVETYAAEKYSDFTAQYDAEQQLLILSKTTSFSLQSAQSIYTDTSTYLTQAQIFALDVSAICGVPELTVELCYLSKDGEPMLSVASDGSVTKHWE
ncbi:MAG: hypothetical protein E7434_08040 [Ruminococcaceae bacterium]|nr:hypothetical protein [Oscillospiraceae bacterium]